MDELDSLSIAELKAQRHHLIDDICAREARGEQSTDLRQQLMRVDLTIFRRERDL